MFSQDVPSSVRTLFLSDLHLGYRLADSRPCLEALDYFDAETICLIGDAIDITRMARVWCWTTEHQDVVEKICALHESGKNVLIMPGNHDPVFGRDMDFLNNYGAKTSSRISQLVEPLMQLAMQETWVHTTSSGKRMLVMHGDQVDNLNVRFFGIPKLGSKIFDYVSVILPNRLTLELRNFFKLILTRPKKIEARAIESARQQQMDGLIMGHLHTPKLMQTHDGLLVGNTGDWVENSSLIVETHDSRFLLVNDGELIATFAV